MKKLLTAIFLFSCLYMQAQMGVGTTSPNSTLDVRGSFSTPVTMFTGNTTAGTTDNLLVFTGTSAATLTLPTAVGITGRGYWVKNASSNSSALTIATTSSQTIDGLSSWSLTQQNKTIHLVSNGTNWYATAESLPGNSGGTSWIHGGNSLATMQNLGTTSNHSLPFITNNTEKMRIGNTGNVAIGTTSWDGTNPEKLLVDAGTTSSFNVISGKGTINNYLQLNIQNRSTGTAASSDIVATADNGSESVNYVDLGINSSGYSSSGILGGANNAYLYSAGNDFIIGNATSNKDLLFFTGGTATTNERMRIDDAGNVGIGTSAPATGLHVVKNNSGANVVSIQNTNAAGYSSLDFFNNSGTLAGTFGYANGSTGAPFTGRTYFNSYGNDFLLANNSIAAFLVDGATSNVGVNNTNPSEKLDVVGNFNLSGAFMPGGTAGTAGYFLVSNGAGNAPTWFNAAGYAWQLGGNTLSSTEEIGTISNHSLPFITNNVERMRISNTGNVGIGTSTFNGTNAEKLIVDAGSGGSAFQNVIVGKGNTNSYAQLNIQNISNGTGASSDVVATSDNGTESVNFIDMGINGSGNTSTGALGGANTAYLYSTGNDLAIGNATAAKDLVFFTGGTAAANERMLINGSGDVAIGATSFDGTNPEQLLVDAGTTTSFNVISGKGTINNYLQLNIQNRSNGTSASSDVVATADNGTESANFIDMGINSSTYSSTGVLAGANRGYLYTTGQDFAIGNSTASKDIIFFTGGTAAANERMRLSSAGHLLPGANNTYNLGSSTLRWATIYSQNALNTSDARLKTNIRNLNYGLSSILNMRPVQYNWKEGNDKDGIGFLAQELRTVIPEVVVGDESKETLAVNYIELIPVLVNAIKEQQQQIEVLKSKIIALEKK